MPVNIRTHVVLPIEEYERLAKLDMIKNALTKLGQSETEWVDADSLGRQLVSERIVRARKAAGLTQKQLGKRLGCPNPRFPGSNAIRITHPSTRSSASPVPWTSTFVISSDRVGLRTLGENRDHAG